MATTKLTDEALLAILDTHPHLRDRIASIVGVVENSDGNLEEADAIEERVTEELRLLGREVIQGWAEGQVEAPERDIRQHPRCTANVKKTPLADEIRRNRGLGAAIPAGNAAGASVQAKRTSCAARLFAAFAAVITDFAADQAFAQVPIKLQEHYGVKVASRSRRARSSGSCLLMPRASSAKSIFCQEHLRSEPGFSSVS